MSLFFTLFLFSRYTSFYKDTCDLFVKSKSSFHEKYFKRVTELINIDEVESAGKVLMTIADTTFNGMYITCREADHVQNCPPFCFLVLEVGDFDQLEFENKRVFTIFFI